MSNTDKRGGGGFRAFLYTQFLFLLFKITGDLTWAWVWILSPMWIWAGLIAISLIVLRVVRASLERKNEPEPEVVPPTANPRRSMLSK